MPNIGLLADSHGRAGATRRAVDALLAAGAERLIHLGDIGTAQVIDTLIGQVPSHLVFGNTDWDWQALARYADSLGVQVNHPTGRLTFDGKIIVFTHGDNLAAMQHAQNEGVHYLCHGHTHVKRDERLGPTRMINPGALFRAAAYSVAMLDTGSDTVTFYPVSRE